LEKIEKLLIKSGSNKSYILSATIDLSDKASLEEKRKYRIIGCPKTVLLQELL